MLKAEYDMNTGLGGVTFEGNLLTIAIELARVVREVYDSIKEDDPDAAENFREGFCEIVKEESGILWDGKNGEKPLVKQENNIEMS